MIRNRLSMSLLLAGLMGAVSPLLLAQEREVTHYSVIASVPDPAMQIRELARLLRSDDLVGLVRAVVPPSQYQRIREAYELGRNKPVTDAERAEFAEKLAKFTARDAVDTLMAEIEPKLIEARPKAAGGILIALGAMQVALASEDTRLTADQRASLQQAMPGVQRWLSTTDFLSSLSMREALTLFTDAARRTGIDNLDELKSMSFEQVLSKAGTMVAASKQALKLYGLDLNAIADSMQVQVLSIEGEKARVRTTVTLFDAPISSEHELVLVEGRWYGKHANAKWHIHDDVDDEIEAEVDAEI